MEPTVVWAKAFAFSPACTCLSMRIWYVIVRMVLLSSFLCSMSLFPEGMGISPKLWASEITSGEKVRLFFFTAPWCSPCHRIQPYLEKICRKNRSVIELIIIDYDESPITVRDFAVESIPTMVLLDRSGKLLLRVNGASKEGLDALGSEIKKLQKTTKK
jgi:thioredoxin 1